MPEQTNNSSVLGAIEKLIGDALTNIVGPLQLPEVSGNLQTKSTPDYKTLTNAIRAAHEKEGGSTFNLREGNLEGKNYYAVSAYPDRQVVVKRLDQKAIMDFIRKNSDVLSGDSSVGTWLATEDGPNFKKGDTVLDVVATPYAIEDAQRLGRKSGQSSIYDLSKKRNLDLSSVY